MVSETELLWIEKYRPKTIDDVVAGKKIVESVLEWAEKWKRGEKDKPLLLAGPPGTGKTSIALALANTFGWEAVELNASDQRNWQVISRIVGEGAFSETLSEEGDFFSTSKSKFKLIILDEVDNIHGREDYGGESALAKIIRRRPAQPMILIANEPYKLSPSLRNLCKVVFFKRLTSRQIAAVLAKICRKERVKADKNTLIAIAENAGGDLRAAINDLQAVAEMKEEITTEDIVVSKRTQETDIFRVIQKIFKKLDPSVHAEAGLLDETPDDLIMWLDENLPLEYRNEELFRAYLKLSVADIFLGRVRKRQYYRLWRYASYLMTVGVQQVKSEEKGGFTKYKRPEVWQKLFQTKAKRDKLDKILSKIGKYSHLSKKKASSEMYIFIANLLKTSDVERAARISAFYDFSEEDIEFIIQDEKKAHKIMEFIKENNLRRTEEGFLKGFEKREEKKEIKKDREKISKPKKEKGKRVTLDFFS